MIFFVQKYMDKMYLLLIFLLQSLYFAITLR